MTNKVVLRASADHTRRCAYLPRPEPEAYEGEERHELKGSSPGFEAACRRLERVAPTRATVLITGESGVGKEAFALRLHRLSPRAARPFVAVNCAAIPETLMESELFGVERGAFTGASAARAGRFERAAGGTLFLDEIATLSLSSQGKLLRALQECELERVGGTRTLQVDVRIVAATNVQLAEAVRSARFRADLWYRLNVFPIQLPPLRERREDIILLVEHFLRRYARRHGRRVSGLTARAEQALLHYAFPGNIRELSNLVERAVIVADDGAVIDVEHLFGRERWADDAEAYNASVACTTPPHVAERQRATSLLDHVSAALGEERLSLHRLEGRLLQEAFDRAGGNLARAARMLGLSRAQLAYRLRRTNAQPRLA